MLPWPVCCGRRRHGRLLQIPRHDLAGSRVQRVVRVRRRLARRRVRGAQRAPRLHELSSPHIRPRETRDEVERQHRREDRARGLVQVAPRQSSTAAGHSERLPERRPFGEPEVHPGDEQQDAETGGDLNQSIAPGPISSVPCTRFATTPMRWPSSTIPRTCPVLASTKTVCGRSSIVTVTRVASALSRPG